MNGVDSEEHWKKQAAGGAMHNNGGMPKIKPGFRAWLMCICVASVAVTGIEEGLDSLVFDWLSSPTITRAEV